MFEQWFDATPIWLLFLLIMGLCLASVRTGVFLAAWALSRTEEREPDAPLAAIVGSLLGLLGFLLAFTYGIAAARFDARRQLVLSEANALSTVFLRAEMLPSERGARVRQLLREYAAARANASADRIAIVLQESEAIHRQLWEEAKAVVHEDMDDEVRQLFIASLNELIDLHQSRKTTGLIYRVPPSIWIAVFALTALSMVTVGYQIGMSGRRGMRGATVLAAAFALVMSVVADIDRPGMGLLRVSQQPIKDTLQFMEQSPP